MIRTFALGWSFLAVIVCAALLRAADDNKENPLDDTQADRAALFDKLDANHDGQITSDEVPEEQRHLFERLLRRADKNGDGKLSREEFLSGMKDMEEHHDRPADRANAGEQPGNGPSNDHRPSDRPSAATEGRAFGGGFGSVPAGGGFGGARGSGFGGGGPLMGMAIFHALDTNGDGKLDAKEIAAAPEVLKKLANSNGEITRDELMKSMPGTIAGGFGGGGLGGVGFAAGGGGGALAGGSGQGEPNLDAMVKRFIQKLDKNGDGKLQKDELPPRMQERFDEMDTNHDGALDEAELKAILPRLMHRLEEERGKGGAGASGRPLRRPPSDSKAPDVKGTDDKMPADGNSTDSKPADSKSDSN